MNQLELEERVYLQKLTFLYSEVPKAVLATLFIGLLLVVVLKDDVLHERLIIWYVLTFLVALYRFAIYFRFKTDKEQLSHIKKYDRLIFAGTLISALIWGSSAVYILPDSTELKFFTIFCLAGLSAGATGSLSSLFKVYAVFVFTAVMPFVIVFLFEDAPYAIFISLALLFYLIAVTSTALKISQNLDKTIRLSFKNEDLVDALKIKAELAEQASEAKSMFLSTMSHEMRTPLNAIMGYISILKKSEKDAKKQHQLDIIDHSSHLLLGVINDILDFNKVSGGELHLEHQKCDLKQELSHLIDLFMPLCKEKKIKLEHQLDKKLPACVMTDVFRLNQILTNLLSNAVKFTPEGKNITVIARYEDSKVYFKVIDEGIGIAKEHQQKIFDSFQQADNSTTRKYGGTGLGLAISNQLALLFGSRLEVLSDEGKGSTFFFDIKVDPCAYETLKQERDLNAFGKQKILVAEDNMTNQMLIRLILEDMNLDVDIVDDGLKAVKHYQEDYKLVLMDINMPNMNGTEAMKKIKEAYPNAVIIALTANALDEDRSYYLGEGFDEYIPKPIETDYLHQVLKQYLG